MKIVKILITAIFLMIPHGFGNSNIPIVKNELLENIICDTVTVTIYTVDDDPKIPDTTASGRILDEHNSKKHRIIAISRDLLGKYNFGDSVLIIGTIGYDGKYIVEDLMHEKWKKRIDILINREDKINKFHNVILFKI